MPRNAMTYSKVRGRMDTLRRRYIRYASPKMARMAADDDVFSFICRTYWYLYEINRGNAPPLDRSEDYGGFLTYITDRDTREFLLDQFSYDDRMVPKRLAKELKALARRY